MREGLINKYGSSTEMNGAKLGKLLGRIFYVIKNKLNDSTLFLEKILIFEKIMLALGEKKEKP
jgi:uncharacterized membrane protein